MDAQFFVFPRGVKLCVYHLGMFTESVPRDKIETTGAVPAEEATRNIPVPFYKNMDIFIPTPTLLNSNYTVFNTFSLFSFRFNNLYTNK